MKEMGLNPAQRTLQKTWSRTHRGLLVRDGCQTYNCAEFNLIVQVRVFSLQIVLSSYFNWAYVVVIIRTSWFFLFVSIAANFQGLGDGGYHSFPSGSRPSGSPGLNPNPPGSRSEHHFRPVFRVGNSGGPIPCSGRLKVPVCVKSLLVSWKIIVNYMNSFI